VAQGPIKKAADQQVEQALQALNLPSRSQVTAVAKQIVELEERIERSRHHHRGASTPRRPGAAMIGQTIAELQPGDRAEMMRVVEEDDIASFIDAVGDSIPSTATPTTRRRRPSSHRSRPASSRRG